MIDFKIIKKSQKSKARIGILSTPHGDIETPALVGVGTSAVVKSLTSRQVEESKTQIIICNTYHLHMRPGENIVNQNGGLHTFMHWPHPIMTDSGGFQVFSLGFGHDLAVGKVLKFFPDKEEKTIMETAVPKHIKITDEGVHFSSPFTGDKFFIGPKESMHIQEKLGADMIFAFDECTAPLASYAYAKRALARTHKWAKLCTSALKSDQALFGIVQGSNFKDLRQESARFINSLDTPGFGIGGDLGENKTDMKNILNWVIPELDERKPRHLLGIGYPEDIEMIITHGVDLFDCTVSTHYGRRGVAFTSKGKINIKQTKFLKDKNPLDPNCTCFVCTDYTRSYLSHLFKAKELTGMSLLSFHNLYFFNSFVESLREKIKNGTL